MRKLDVIKGGKVKERSGLELICADGATEWGAGGNILTIESVERAFIMLRTGGRPMYALLSKSPDPDNKEGV